MVPLLETAGQVAFHALKKAWNDREEAPFRGASTAASVTSEWKASTG